jgi:hypothetical protein
VHAFDKVGFLFVRMESGGAYFLISTTGRRAPLELTTGCEIVVMTSWSLDDMPDLSGRTAIVTGANTGIGLQVASGLAKAGATVVMAARDRISDFYA